MGSAMTRRRNWEGVGEPLFGEDWWVSDQRLFEDSVARKASRSPPPRRSRRPSTLRRQDAAAGQGMLPWFEDPPGDADELLRGDGPRSLGTVAPGPVRADPGSGQLLLGPWEPGGDEDRRPGGRAGRGRPAGRGLPEQGGPDRPGTPAGRGDRPGRGDPAGARTRSGPRRPAAPGLAPFRPRGQDDLAPSGAVSRVRANLAALAVLRTLQHDARAASRPEQAVLARWSGWGAVPEVFDDDREEFAWARTQLDELLSPAELAAARRNTINAHYTDGALVKAIWEGARKLGFERGRVLEPGCGSGNFIGFAPEGTQVTGVELDPVKAGIATALYPQAQILAGSFAGTRDADGSYDLVIGNVPFGQAVLHDRRHNPSGHSIHNHFIIKSLRLTRPGGLVMALTSRYTMDARNPAARREIASLADLAGAMRLPSGAPQRAAGTGVVTDLLILRRREPGRQPDPAAWEQARMTELDGAQVPVNEYFLDHPDMVLGDLGAVHGAYRADDLVVRPAADTVTALACALDAVAASARERGLTWTPAAHSGTGRQEPAASRSREPDGYIRAQEDGTFTRVLNGSERSHEVPRSQAGELRGLLGLRDTVRALLDAESASGADTPHIDGLRAELNRQYEAYLRTYGPLNRSSLRRTGRIDPATGEETKARTRPPQGGFRIDPYAPVVYALEEFDPVGQRAAKAAICRERVIAPRAARLGADNAADALAICLDTHGEASLAEIARLLGTSQDDAREQLGTLVFDDPESGKLLPAAEYLSGNVRDKLRAADPC